LRIDLIGKVASGRQEGGKYLGLDWVQMQMNEKLGFTPYSGTLNLHLDDESTKRKGLLGENKASKLCREGFCTGLLFKASMCGLACGVVIPQVENYPEDELEIVADVNLRLKLRLYDGDKVTVTVFL